MKEDLTSQESTGSSSWVIRMLVLMLVEKFIALVLLAIGNFIIPFGSEWLKLVFLALPGLVVIDCLYGRIIFFFVFGARLKLHKLSRPIVEAVLYFVSLIVTFAIVIMVTGKAQIVLFWGKHPWNCIAFYLTLTAAVIAIGIAIYGRRKLTTLPD